MIITRRTVLTLGAAALVLPVARPAAAQGPEPVGGVSDLINIAWATRPAQPRAGLEENDVVVMEETIETEPESAAHLTFADGSTLSIGERSVITIDAFVYNPETQGGLSTLSLVKGSFRFVSGAMPKDNVLLQSPTVSMGIRGTEMLIDVAEDGETEVSLLSGSAICTSRLSGRVLRVAARQSVLANRAGVWQGGVRGFVHRPRSLAIADGFAAARRRWRRRRRRPPERR